MISEDDHPKQKKDRYDEILKLSLSGEISN